MTKFIATWFGIGLLPKIPGTWGAISALPFAFLMLWVGFGWIDLLILTGIVFGLGVWSIHAETRGIEDPDQPEFVIDEVTGQWVALFPLFWANTTGLSFAATLEPGSEWFGLYFFQASIALGLFRFFEAFRPWPMSLYKAKPTALGVMLGDFIAGIITAICLFALNYILFNFGLSLS